MTTEDSALQIFRFDNVATGSSLTLSALEKDGQAWFVAADVCKALDIDPTATRRLDADEKGLHTTQTLGGRQQVGVINESGLYSLIFSSRKESARAFKKWVTAVVLPSIRQHGGYINGQEALSTEDKAHTLQVVQDEAARVRARHVEDREARSDAHKFMNRGRKRRKIPRAGKMPEDTRNGY